MRNELDMYNSDIDFSEKNVKKAKNKKPLFIFYKSSLNKLIDKYPNLSKDAYSKIFCNTTFG